MSGGTIFDMPKCLQGGRSEDYCRVDIACAFHYLYGHRNSILSNRVMFVFTSCDHRTWRQGCRKTDSSDEIPNGFKLARAVQIKVIRFG